MLGRIQHCNYTHGIGQEPIWFDFRDLMNAPQNQRKIHREVLGPPGKEGRTGPNLPDAPPPRKPISRELFARRPITERGLGTMKSMARQLIKSGSPFEAMMGFSRAVRVGKAVAVAGTAPIWPDESVDPDPYVQARRCLEIIGAALTDAGAGFADIVRTRMFITDRSVAEAVGRAHGEVFGTIGPASTMVVVTGLLDERWKVEIEADATVG